MLVIKMMLNFKLEIMFLLTFPWELQVRLLQEFEVWELVFLECLNSKWRKYLCQSSLWAALIGESVDGLSKRAWHCMYQRRRNENVTQWYVFGQGNAGRIGAKVTMDDIIKFCEDNMFFDPTLNNIEITARTRELITDKMFATKLWPAVGPPVDNHHFLGLDGRVLTYDRSLSLANISNLEDSAPIYNYLQIQSDSLIPPASPTLPNKLIFWEHEPRVLHLNGQYWVIGDDGSIIDLPNRIVKMVRTNEGFLFLTVEGELYSYYSYDFFVRLVNQNSKSCHQSTWQLERVPIKDIILDFVVDSSEDIIFTTLTGKYSSCEHDNEFFAFCLDMEEDSMDIPFHGARDLLVRQIRMIVGDGTKIFYLGV